MPLYEYACTACGHRLEILQRLGETEAGLKCPACNGERLEKQFSTFAASSDGKAASTAPAGCGGGSGFT